MPLLSQAAIRAPPPPPTFDSSNTLKASFSSWSLLPMPSFSISAFALLPGGELSSLPPSPSRLMVAKLQYPRTMLSPSAAAAAAMAVAAVAVPPPPRQPDNNDTIHQSSLVNAAVAAPLSALSPSAIGPLEVVVVHGVMRCGEYGRVLSTQGLYQFVRSCN
jgi:hypothetical protein